jgi:hypothetical protein
VVIAPFFHLHDDSGTWPPSPETTLAAKAAFRPLLRAPGLDVHQYARFAVLRRRR